MRNSHVVTKLSKDTLIADLASAIAASLCPTLFTSFISFQNQNKADFFAYARYFFLAITAYSVVALLLGWLWTKRLRRIIPSWIIIAFLGSILFVLVRLLPSVIKGWNDPYNMESSLLKYLLTELDSARSVVIVLSILTLPISGIIHYNVSKFAAKYHAEN